MTPNEDTDDVTALTADPRFGYLCAAPPSGRSDRPLLIVVHGSERDAGRTLQAFRAFAEQTDIGLLAPHFPAYAADPRISDGYKFLREPGVDYVDILESMVAQVMDAQPFDRGSLFLFGFSGGAQFALRYGLVQASRLAGLMVAAPGNVTLLDADRGWWAGTRDARSAIGRDVDIDGLRRLPIFVTVGDHDLRDGMIKRDADDPFYSPDEDVAGDTRVARARSLAESLVEARIPATFELVPAAGHDLLPLAAAATAWLRAQLRSHLES